MPKDPPRNQPNYKIGGYHINEHEYEQNKGQISKEGEDLPRNKQPAKSSSGSETENEAGTASRRQNSA